MDEFMEVTDTNAESNNISLEELELSLHNLSIVDSDNDNNDDVDDGCQPMASTPKKKFGDGPSSKHNLTPDSKRTKEPASKRTHITMSPTVSDASHKSNPGRAFFRRRQEKYVQILHEKFEVKYGSYVEQSSVLEALGLDEFHKIQATNAMKQAFPGTNVMQKGSRNSRVVHYKDIGHKSCLHPVRTEPVEGHSTISSGIPNKSSEIENINKLISMVKAELSSVSAKIDEKLSSNVEIQTDVLKAHLSTQANLQKRLEELHGILVKLLQKVVNRLTDEQSQYTMIHSAEARQLNK